MKIQNKLAVVAATTMVLPMVTSNHEDCIDLTPYASNPEDLKIVRGGGDVPHYVPVFFDIPAQFVTGEVVYCLENMTIPTMVGGNHRCEEEDSCYLALGLHAGQDNDASAIETCTNSTDGSTNDCYQCACTGMSIASGPINNTLANSCGLKTDWDWDMTCEDVTQATSFNDMMIGEEVIPASNFSTVHVSICSENGVEDCSVCRGGGLHPSIRIGIQWITNLEEECYDNPFVILLHDRGVGAKNGISPVVLRICLSAVFDVFIVLVASCCICRALRRNYANSECMNIKKTEPSSAKGATIITTPKDEPDIEEEMSGHTEATNENWN